MDGAKPRRQRKKKVFINKISKKLDKIELVQHYTSTIKNKSVYLLEDVKIAWEEGYNTSNKIAYKILLDTLNKYKSWLQQEQTVKPDKVMNVIYIAELINKIDALQEILNKTQHGK